MNDFSFLWVFIGLSVYLIIIGLLSRKKPKQPNNNDFLPVEENKNIVPDFKNKRRDELISYITNKALDTYEDSLLKELEVMTDKKLLNIVEGYKTIDDLAPKKDTNI